MFFRIIPTLVSLYVVIDACELHQLLLQWFCANSVLQNLSPAKGRTNITWAIEGIRKEILTVRRVKWVQPFGPAHNLIRPQPRSFLPYRRRIHNLVVHQRRSPLPCRRSILLRRSASLHRSRTAAPGRARGLALLRNLQGCQRGLSVIFFFLSGFSFF